MEPTVEIVDHAMADRGREIITFRVRYWRPIHSEVMTHRVFTRNARSSRAVPNKVLLREPVVEPMVYGANIPGMQSGEPLRGWRLLLARTTWLALAHITRAGVRLLHLAGLHKQWSNRPLEWFGSIDVLITTTRTKNFYALRIHGAAQPEIRELARLMKAAHARSQPRELKYGDWYLPYTSGGEIIRHGLKDAIKLDVARCARISYRPFDGSDSLEAELARYDRLVGSAPMHASPAEHQATPDLWMEDLGRWAHPELHGNLPGFIQYRKTLPGESFD